MRQEDQHPGAPTRPNLMTTTPRPVGGADENILARLERDKAAAARRARRPRAKVLAAPAIAAVAALIWMLMGPVQDRMQDAHETPVLVATPAPAEPAPAEPAVQEPASLEPVAVLPMLADVAEPAAPAPAQRAPLPGRRSAARPPRHLPSRSTAPVKEGDVETDVALLSTILIHAPRHSAERARAEAACKLDKDCTIDTRVPAMLEDAD